MYACILGIQTMEKQCNVNIVDAPGLKSTMDIPESNLKTYVTNSNVADEYSPSEDEMVSRNTLLDLVSKSFQTRLIALGEETGLFESFEKLNNSATSEELSEHANVKLR